MVLEIDPIPVLSRKEGINQLINKKNMKRKMSTAIYTDQWWAGATFARSMLSSKWGVVGNKSYKKKKKKNKEDI